MLKRQQRGEQMFQPAQVESSIRVLAAAHPDRPASTWDILRSVLADGAESLDRRLEQSGRLEPQRFSLRGQRAFGQAAAMPEVRTKFRVEVVCISDVGQVHHSHVLEMERGQLAMETLGLNLCESKVLLEACRSGWSPGRRPRIWSSGAAAQTAAIDTPPRAVERLK